jgi:hypothetical protein
MEDDLEQHIAELLANLVRVAAIEGLEKLVSFFEQAGLERGMSLLAIPRTARCAP